MSTPIDISTYPEFKALVHKMAGVQPAEGTHIDGDTWVWIQAFADFDYEYAYLIDVRSRKGESTQSRYLAVFEGYDHRGQSFYRSTWWGAPVTFPEVPNLYDALAWWAGWVKNTRGEAHGVDETA